MDEVGKADLRAELTRLLPELRAYARFLLRDRTHADDLVHDTVVRALGALAQFQAGTNLKAWLFTIQRNLFREHGRRRQLEARALLEEAALRGPEPSHDGGSAARDLTQLLWRLSPLLREALVLVGAQELTHDEAAAICGVPAGTMRARVARARAQLARESGLTDT